MIHDPMDNITNKNTEHGAYQYDYDDLYRLTNVDNPTQDDEAFTYDPVGNRLTAADTSGNWSYNQNNELQSYDNVSYVYDDNGNMIQKTDNGVVTNYIYNQEDRMVRVEDGSSTVIAEYYYDPAGRRLWKDVSGTRTHFHYAEEGLIGEYDSIGVESKSYGYNPDSTWTTNPLFMKEGGNYYFYQNDHLGTTQKMTAVNGAIVWSVIYSSFGEANIDVSSTVANNLRFPGQYFDQETGLHYNYHRCYDPKIGRYLRADPVGIKEGKNHLYVYAIDNPLKYTDPHGLMPLFGIEDCSNTSPICDKYKPCDEYSGANARCFCKCAGNDYWSQIVRCCLRKMYDEGYSGNVSHAVCYSIATAAAGVPPVSDLADCYVKCRECQKKDCECKEE